MHFRFKWNTATICFCRAGRWCGMMEVPKVCTASWWLHRKSWAECILSGICLQREWRVYQKQNGNVRLWWLHWGCSAEPAVSSKGKASEKNNVFGQHDYWAYGGNHKVIFVWMFVLIDIFLKFSHNFPKGEVLMLTGGWWPVLTDGPSCPVYGPVMSSSLTALVHTKP